jgi:hypothetical protein
MTQMCSYRTRGRTDGMDNMSRHVIDQDLLEHLVRVGISNRGLRVIAGRTAARRARKAMSLFVVRGGTCWVKGTDDRGHERYAKAHRA